MSTGVFFMTRRDAEKALLEVRGSVDPKAIVQSVPLDQAWTLAMTKTPAEVGGKFRLQPDQHQVKLAVALGAPKSSLKGGAVPLFFDRRMAINGEEAFPLFFRFEDLDRVYALSLYSKTFDQVSISGPVQAQVTTLENIVATIKSGEQNSEKVVLLTPETFNQ
uniref:Uncharacterized protein n=2 Tax=Rhizochromulina marina TaxID=1034831 RepID=A0A7S2RF04_9STRA|mmetsp:Transcript_15345/g.45465  ORF Transcript_15345/g.45465 Transcript_15345/m.45465 type:complete len:163 (+) Transcript_15345:23-511(+)